MQFPLLEAQYIDSQVDLRGSPLLHLHSRTCFKSRARSYREIPQKLLVENHAPKVIFSILRFSIPASNVHPIKYFTISLIYLTNP